MAITRIGEANIEYYVDGEGPPLLMIMGFAGMATAWGEPFLGLMRSRFTTIRLSNRGSGLSDLPPEPLTIPLMADDAAGLLAHLKIERAHVLGISMGGMIAQELALRHPGRVRGLVLGCTNCGPAHSTMPQPEILARMGQLMTLVEKPIAEPMAEQINEFWKITLTPEFVERSQEFLAAMVAEGMKTPPTLPALARQFAAIQSFDTFDRLPQIKAPTLVIHGNRDLLVPVENAPILHERIAGSRLRIVDGVGHMFVWEKPDEAAAAVAEFLESAPAAV